MTFLNFYLSKCTHKLCCESIIFFQVYNISQNVQEDDLQHLQVKLLIMKLDENFGEMKSSSCVRNTNIKKQITVVHM